MDDAKLVAFLYLLARDIAPVGKIEKALQDVGGDCREFVYDSNELEALARSWAKQLVAGRE